MSIVDCRLHFAGVQTGDAVGRCDDVDVAH